MIGERIKELRKSRKLTLKQFGIQFGLSESTISQYENENRTPDYEVLKKIADFFEVSTDYLLGRTDEPSTKSLDEQLEGVNFALYKEAEELSDADKRDVLNFIQFMKQKKQKEK